MAFSETLIQHGAWLMLNQYVSEGTDIVVAVREHPPTKACEVIIAVRPQGSDKSVTFIEHTNDSFVGFPSDELITKLMMIG